jgi:hypothetical protein
VSLDQKRARAFGVLYLITFVTSIPAALLYRPLLDHPIAYIAGGGHDNQIIFGALLELLLIIANIGTAVVIFPIIRRQNEELSLGYVTARIFECTFILVGVLAVLGIVTLHQQIAGAAEGTTAYTLAALKDWTFLLGPGWVLSARLDRVAFAGRRRPGHWLPADTGGPSRHRRTGGGRLLPWVASRTFASHEDLCTAGG